MLVLRVDWVRIEGADGNVGYASQLLVEEIRPAATRRERCPHR